MMRENAEAKTRKYFFFLLLLVFLLTVPTISIYVKSRLVRLPREQRTNAHGLPMRYVVVCVGVWEREAPQHREKAQQAKTGKVTKRKKKTLVSGRRTSATIHNALLYAFGVPAAVCLGLSPVPRPSPPQCKALSSSTSSSSNSIPSPVMNPPTTPAPLFQLCRRRLASFEKMQAEMQHSLTS